MSLASGRMDYDSSHSTSTPSPVGLKETGLSSGRYSNCYYHHGRYCCSKICTIVVLLLFTTLAGVAMGSLSLWLDNWAGISTNPYATLDLKYPRLGSKHLDYVMFNKTIPNDDGTLYKYIDNGGEDVRFMTSRYGLLSHCKIPVQGPKIALFKTPWIAPVCKASYAQYQCPIVAMRTLRGSEPKSPRALSYRKPINGCIKAAQQCDGTIDCPTGHDELNCPQPEQPCGPGMIQCSANKPICIPKARVCNGINDCGMYEDEQNCCGRAGFLRCGDGSCVIGERCDAKADCFDLSDEYDCPDPASEFYSKCNDGQLIESTYVCEKKEYANFQCKDFSDETECDFDPKPLPLNPALLSLKYDKHGKCFKQSFTFTSLNQTMLDLNFPDKTQQEFAKKFEYSSTKLVILVAIGVAGVLSLLSIILLLCFGKLNRKCKPMRATFIVLAFIYATCIIQTLLTGIYWVKYVDALNAVLENPTSSNMYEQVAIETVQVTGGLASIRISTQLTFYNCGFFGLAMILSIIAAQILKNSSCHTHGAISYPDEYKQTMYSDDQLTVDERLLGRISNDSTDNGVATPDQIVTPQRSVRSYDVHTLPVPIRIPTTYYSHNHLHPGSGTYISYNNVDSIDKIDTYSHPSMAATMDRGTVRSARSTQV